jgi:hypothetical protein
LGQNGVRQAVEVVEALPADAHSADRSRAGRSPRMIPAMISGLPLACWMS